MVSYQFARLVIAGLCAWAAAMFVRKPDDEPLDSRPIGVAIVTGSVVWLLFEVIIVIGSAVAGLIVILKAIAWAKGPESRTHVLGHFRDGNDEVHHD